MISVQWAHVLIDASTRCRRNSEGKPDPDVWGHGENVISHLGLPPRTSSIRKEKNKKYMSKMRQQYKQTSKQKLCV